jgi:hypothetical protein
MYISPPSNVIYALRPTEEVAQLRNHRVLLLTRPKGILLPSPQDSLFKTLSTHSRRYSARKIWSSHRECTILALSTSTRAQTLKYTLRGRPKGQAE